MTATHVTELEAARAELAQNVEQARSQARGHQAGKQELQDQVIALEKQIAERVGQEAEASKQKVAELEASLASERSRIEALEVAAKEAAAREAAPNEKATQELEAQKARVKELEAARAADAKKVEDLQGVVTLGAKALADLRTKTSALEEREATIQKRLAETQVALAHEQKRAFETAPGPDYEAVKKQKAQLEEMLITLRASYGELQFQVSAEADRHTTTTTQLMLAREQISKQVGTIERLTAESRRLRERVANLEIQVGGGAAPAPAEDELIRMSAPSDDLDELDERTTAHTIPPDLLALSKLASEPEPETAVRKVPAGLLNAARRREGLALPDPNELILEESKPKEETPVSAAFELQVEEPGAALDDAEEILIVDVDNPSGGAKKGGPK